MQLKETIVVKGTIEVLTGLHIAAGNENIEIGGLDLPVIKNPRTQQPYIPGSSLKGKMRFLSEWKLPGKVKVNGDVHTCDKKDCPICRVFGTTEVVEGRGPTRLVVRDAELNGNDDYQPDEILEVKYENTINRVTGTAKNPRPIERVTPGTTFGFEISYRVFDMGDGTDDTRDFGLVREAMKMLESDTLGGSGSRGSGKIAFRNITVTGGGLDGTYENTDRLLEAGKGAA